MDPKLYFLIIVGVCVTNWSKSFFGEKPKKSGLSILITLLVLFYTITTYIRWSFSVLSIICFVFSISRTQFHWPRHRLTPHSFWRQPYPRLGHPTSWLSWSQRRPEIRSPAWSTTTATFAQRLKERAKNTRDAGDHEFGNLKADSHKTNSNHVWLKFR
jgi:hypothetical protein